MKDWVATLEPEVQDKALAHLALCAREGILLRVTQGRRTHDEQAAIYAKGRTAPGEPCYHQGVSRPVGSCPQHPLGKAVTNAGPGWSIHEYGRAYDVAEKDKTPYDLGEPGPRDDDPLWNKIGEAGESLDLEWGGRWKWPDRPHFSYLGIWTLASLRKDAIERGELVA